MLRYQAGHAARLEGRTTGQHLEEHCSQAIDIRLRAELFAFALFRRHVVESAHHCAGLRKCSANRDVAQFGETKIDYFRHLAFLMTCRCDDDVIRFQIAMQQPLPVGYAYARTDVSHQSDRPLSRHSTFALE